jgi:hypothetical protein
VCTLADMDVRAGAVTLLGLAVLPVVLVLLNRPAGRASRAITNALIAVAVIAMVFNVVMLATSHADPVSGMLLFGSSAIVLGLVPIQRGRLRRHLQVIQARLDQAHHTRPSGR